MSDAAPGSCTEFTIILFPVFSSKPVTNGYCKKFNLLIADKKREIINPSS